MHEVYLSKYKDIEAVTLESDSVKVQFLPEYGGKMASLVYKKTSREFLVQAPGSSYKALDFAGEYTEAECSGFDDMFPTIDKFYYPEQPWKGIEMADHGEVCRLKWDYEIGPDYLYMYVSGIRLPYKLEKRITFESDHCVSIDYKATNLSQFDMDFLWAAHPMLDTTDGGEILVPYKGQQDTTCVFSSDKNLGSYGDSLVWPETLRKDGSTEQLAWIEKRESEQMIGKTYKYFFKDRLPEGWCAFHFKPEDTILRFSFPEEKVPFLGIWNNGGEFKSYTNVALEMCTGSLDRPDLAKMHNQNSVLRGKSEYSWQLKLHVESLNK